MIPLPHSRTVSIVRLLQTIGGVRKTPGRIPRQQQPDAIRFEYFNALNRAVVAPTISAFRGVQTEILQLLIQERRQQGKMDVARSRQAVELIDRAAAHAARQLAPRELNEIAEKFGKRTSDFNRAQLDRQIRSAMGVNLSAIEKPTRDLIPTFAKANVELIQTVPTRYHDRIAKDVREAFETGVHPETLAERFVELDDMVESDARRIARDQVGKLNGLFNQTRQQAMGVTDFVWRTVHNARVRDEHANLDGRTFDWEDGAYGIFPGSEIMCRCFAEPVFDDILRDIG